MKGMKEMKMPAKPAGKDKMMARTSKKPKPRKKTRMPGIQRY